MRKISFVLLVFIMLLAVSFAVSAEGGGEKYTLKYVHGEYILCSGDEELKRETSIMPLLSELDGDVLNCENVRIYEPISLSEVSLCLTGSIFLDSGAKIKIDGGSLTLSNIDVKILDEEGGFELLGGKLALNSARISGEAERAITVERGDALLEIFGNTEIRTSKYDISTKAPIYLTGEFGEKYIGSDKFKVEYIGAAESLSNIIKAERTTPPPVNIFSQDGEEIKFYAVTYINEFGEDFCEYRLKNERFSLLAAEEVDGYEFAGWSTGASSSLAGDLTCMSAMTLSAEYRLLSPEFFVNGLSFTYDGEYHTLAPSAITHPLLDEGDLKFVWYKDGVPVSHDRAMQIRNVNDGGSYTLVAEFSYKEDVSFKKTENIRVDISPIMLTTEFVNGKFELLSGALLSGDRVTVNTAEKDGMLYAVSDNPNYCLKFTTQISENKTLSIEIVAWAMVLIAILSAVAFIVFCSAEADSEIAVMREIDNDFLHDKYVASSHSEGELREKFFGVNAAKADELLSDRLAKSMISKGEFVMTDGSGISTVSLGEINSSFKAGERADICEMKRRGLISNEILKVRITPEGIIDKPIKIMANEFDISAVKMISLAGGEAVKVKSRRKI